MSKFQGFRIALGGDTVAYRRVLAEVGGSAAAGVVYCQLLYWDSRMADKHGNEWDGWFYKPDYQLEEECGCSRRERDEARRVAQAKGILEMQVRGVPATMHYRWNWEKLEAEVIAAEERIVARRQARARALAELSLKRQAAEREAAQFVQGVQTGETLDQSVQGVQASLHTSREQVCTPRANLFAQGEQTIQEIKQEIQPERETENRADNAVSDLEQDACSEKEAEPEAARMWNAAMRELQLQMTKATFEAWLKPTHALAYALDSNPPVLTVQVRNEFAKQWLEGRLYETIRKEVERSAGRARVQVRFVPMPAPT